MSFQVRGQRRAFVFCVALFLFFLYLPLNAAEKMRLRVDDYQIEAELNPHAHKLAARAKVRFTALEDLNIATFELHNGLRVTKVLDQSGKPLSAERVTQDSTVRVQLATPLTKDNSTTLTFEYEGVLDSADESPVQGLKLAYVGDDTSYLLYAGRWFPVNAYGINRFTATMSITVPAHMIVIGSGKESVGSNPAPKRSSGGSVTGKTYVFTWDKPSFPGTIVAGSFQEFKSDEAGLDLHVFFKPAHQNLGAIYAGTAVKEFTYYVTLYGTAPSTTLKVVEIPDDTVPSAWAPGIAAVASRAVTDKVNYRLLANTIAHQWWGASVSPASRDDWWLNDGFARYSEARYVEQAAGPAGLEETVKDMSVGALAYDTVPLSSVGKLDPFSPEFQSLVTDKGAMILHMLRWVMGDQKYNQTMRTFAAKYAGKSASVAFSPDGQFVADAFEDNDANGSPVGGFDLFRVSDGAQVLRMPASHAPCMTTADPTFACIIAAAASATEVSGAVDTTLSFMSSRNSVTAAARPSPCRAGLVHVGIEVRGGRLRQLV